MGIYGAGCCGVVGITGAGEVVDGPEDFEAADIKFDPAFAAIFAAIFAAFKPAFNPLPNNSPTNAVVAIGSCCC
jgi:hypothetical protein